MFVTLVIGGWGAGGPMGSVDYLTPVRPRCPAPAQPAARYRALPSLPHEAMVGGSECSAAYTGAALMTCTSGSSFLTPYGWIYSPGTCYNYSFGGGWRGAGGALASYRRGASLVRLGPYLLALGGRRKRRSYNSVEVSGVVARAQVLDSRAPGRGWRVSRQLEMPAGVAEHCAVTVAGGPGGRELLVTGGRGRGARVMKLNLRTKTWYSLHRLEEGRRRHACTKVTLNGRPGVVVSGGASSTSANSTSVEFYDSSSGQWFTLPPLQVRVVVFMEKVLTSPQRGRRSHAMTVQGGRMVVTGGLQVTGHPFTTLFTY